MSIRTLARLTGINRGHLSRVERGLAGLGEKNIHLVAEALDVPPHRIIRESTQEKT